MPRPRKTCTECSLRRQKCDRQTPCGRCLRRGVAEKCTVRWHEPYNPQIHRAYPRTPRPKIHPARSVTSVETIREAQSQCSSHSQSATFLGKDAHAENWLESLSQPTLTDERPPPRNRILDRGVSSQSWLSPQSIGPRPPAHDVPHQNFLQTLLPSADHIWKLVHYHEVYLLWYHGCYHGPTLRSELESALDDQDGQAGTLVVRGLNLQWLALLFAIMAGSVTCATETRLAEWGFSKSEVTSLSEQWYKATISCLNEAEYTSNPDMYSIHALATLSMSAHPLGHSQELSVLLGAALKIAQCLGVNRLHHDPALENISGNSKEEQRHKLLKREIGRRLWSFLCINDWMSLPFTDSHNINPLHFTSIKPSSRNHLTMDPITPTFPTYTSYGNYLYEIAKLMVNHNDAMLQTTTQFTLYETVMQYDSRIRTLATQGIPRYFHVIEPIDPAWPPWIIWARKSLTICFAHKIIMVHRAFIRKSFTDPAYAVTRRTCLAASKTILNEAKHKGVDGPIIWVDKAFCVAAGVILCLDIFHRSETEVEFQTHRDLVTNCISMLQKFETSAIAVRGVIILSALIEERERLGSKMIWPPQSTYISDIVESLGTVRDSLYAASSEDANALPELLPPQAGFSNRFLFEDLLR